MVVKMAELMVCTQADLTVGLSVTRLDIELADKKDARLETTMVGKMVGLMDSEKDVQMVDTSAMPKELMMAAY